MNEINTGKRRLKPIYSENIIDTLLKNINTIWNFIKSNYALLIIIVSILGGSVQVIKFLTLAPSLIVYYSPKQGLLDGALFLVFLIFLITFFILFTFFIVYLNRLLNGTFRIILSVIIFALQLFLVYWFNTYQLQNLVFFIVFITLIIVSFCLVYSFEGDKMFVVDLNNESDDPILANKNLKRNNARINLILFLVCLFYSFSAYYDSISELNSIGVLKIYNYTKFEKELKSKTKINYEYIYSNGDFIIFGIKSKEQFVVVKSDQLTTVSLK